MNPKIIVFVGDMTGCGYYRAVLPYRQLTEHGFDVTICNDITEANLAAQDVVVLQRQHGDGVLAAVEKLRNDRPDIKLVFEFDDNVHAIPRTNQASDLYRTGMHATKNIEKFLRIVDGVTVSTEALAREYERYNSNIHVCHNAVDPNLLDDVLSTPQENRACVCPLFGHLHKPKQDDEFRIGWAGSATHASDFQTVIKPLSGILDEFPKVTIVLFGHNLTPLFPKQHWGRCRYVGESFPRDKNGRAVPYNPDGKNNVLDYYKMLRSERLDVAIAPLERFVFNDCKSYIKLIEYGVAQIPFVATRFGPYRRYVSRATNQVGLTADTDSEWRRALKEMITKPDLRATLVKNNYEYIKSNHLVPQHSHEWLSALETLGIVPGSQPGVYQEKIVKS